MRPYKEVILVDNIDGNSNVGRLTITNNTNIQLKKNAVQILWRGSIDKFKSDFEIPEDSPLSTKELGGNGIGSSGNFVSTWRLTTLNFKLNYQVWYRDGANTNSGDFYVNGSNNTINLTVPNVLVFNGDDLMDSAIHYAYSSGAPIRVYNPNVFPIPISITSFITSNKVSDFQNVGTNAGTDSLCYLVFRYGVDGDDIQICLLTKDSTNFQVNSRTLVIPYVSLTFTGFNRIKRL